MFMRADFNGVTIDLARWGLSQPATGRTLDDIRGANSTPPNMLASTEMMLYPRKVQDAHLTESAERFLTHYVIANWNDPDTGADEYEPGEMVQWAQYVQSWGYHVVYWAAQPMLNDPILQALVDAHALSWCIPGEEVDRKVTKEQYEAILDDTLSITANGIPIGAHFTANWPEGFPRDTMVPNWSKYDGKLHLMWQANQDESAGMQAARLYYARERLALGSVGGDGTPSPRSRVYAFETMATAQLYGQCDEAYGNLRGLELLYATRNDARIPPMAGTGNGGNRLPDGTPF
jgi:hypothetical protein